MLWTSVVGVTTATKGFRSAVNAYTGTLTITARTIGVGTPVILETNTASANGMYVRRPATSTALVNNLFVGIVAQVPNGNPTYLDSGQDGLVQAHGFYADAVIQQETAGASVGAVLIPSDLQNMIPVGGPITAAATATAGHVEVPAIGGLAYLVEAVATSSATSTAAADIFLRAV